MGEQSDITQRAFLTSARLRINRLSLAGGLEHVFQQVVDISAQALEVERVSVWLFNPASNQLDCKALHDGREGMHRVRLPMNDLPVYVSVLRSKRFIAATHARTDLETKELANYFEVHGIVSLLDAAIYRDGEVVGVVCHEQLGTPREWRREERQFAATVADLTSTFLEADERMQASAKAHELELRLKDAHRLDALGRLSAGVAHDLNNLLGTISNGLVFLKRAVEHEPAGQRVLQLLEEQASHAATLVEQLVALGRGKPTLPTSEPLDALLESIRLVVATEFHAPWKLVVDAHPKLTVWADSTQFRQVFINLLLNAKEAMPTGGIGLLRVREAPGSVVLEVIDTGEGIAPEHLERIFDPYFTTRSRGSGIGLSIVQQIIHQHGGELHVSSTIGDGTTVRVTWPIAAAASSQSASAPTQIE